MEATVEGKYLMYKGKPLVREGNQLCYGSMADEYVLYLMILSEKEVTVGGVKTKVPDRVFAQIIKSDPNIPPLERMIKQFDKTSLYDAFNAGIAYLEKLLAK